MTPKQFRRAMMGACLLALPASATFAVPVVYQGVDFGAASLAAAPNSVAAAAAFDAAAGAINLLDFEAGLPADVNIGPGSVTNNSTCAAALCGYNTTAGGQFFYLAFGGVHTFTFANPIDSFGAYFTGWQIGTQTITYVDGNQVVLDMPAADINAGGTAFFGFIDAGASIASVTYNAVNDIVSVDDLRYGRAVPAPGPLALLGIGLVGLAFARRKAA